jgi:hypothetical protein
MTRLAQLVAKEEGFGRAGVLPTVDNNPGDLRHSPHSSHAGEDPNAIGKIDTAADGWADLERQLRIDADRGLTLQQAIYEWAPLGDGGNNPGKYLSDICNGLQMPANSKLVDVLKIQAV